MCARLRLTSIAILVLACGCTSGDRGGQSSPFDEATERSASESDGSVAAVDDADSGWVGFDSSAVIYMSFVKSPDGEISGLIQLARISNSGTTVDSRSDSVSGTVSGSQIAIKTFSQSWTGEISDDSLDLTFANLDGTLSQMHLSRGSIDAYNRQVSLLTANAQAATEASIANSVAEARSAQTTQLVANLQRETTYLNSFTADLPTLQQDVETSVRDVQTAADEARTLFNSCDDVPYALDSVTYAVESVTYASDSVGYTIDSIKSEEDTVRSLVAQVQGTTDNADAPSAISAANTAINQADDHIASAIASYTASFNSANEILVKVGSEAAAVCSSVEPPPPVTTLP